jgi:glutamine amidotransferase
MSKTVIIDYGSGNLRSVAKAFEHAKKNISVEEVVVTNDPAELSSASHIVLPGVGAFADCKAGLEAVPGMIEALDEQVTQNKKPFLGICVGMQLMATRGLEHGETAGFDWIAGEVVEIKPSDASLKIPHMGWNALDFKSNAHPVLAGFEAGVHAYFVHSYYFAATSSENVLVSVDYGGSVTAMIAQGNMIGTQFHPEKSQHFGLAFIENFLKWPGTWDGSL